MELELIYQIVAFLSFLASMPLLGFIGSGGGVDGDPYLITNMAELNDVRNELDAFYRLENDLDAGAETDNSGGTYWNAGAGWNPIGGSASPFTGDFNGNGFTIDGLFINRSATREIGLFARNTGNIYDLKATGANITGERETGVIAGYNRTGGVIERCEAIDCVVAGLNHTGIISGRSADADTTFRNCKSEGGSVTVDGTDAGGGLVGSTSNDVTIEKCMAAVQILGTSTSKHGLASGTATDNDNFYDNSLTGTGSSDLGTGKSNADMKLVATFTDTATVGLTNPWDFVDDPNDDAANNDYWDINASEYPHLVALVNTPSDTTDPTLPSGSTITKGTILHDRFTVSFPKAADETTAEANLVYKLFVSDQNDLDTDTDTVESNGVEVASDTDVTQLTSSDLSALGSPFNPGDEVWTVVVAYDEAGNGVIYDQVEVTLQAIYGNVTRNSSAVENADVAIFTVDGPHLGNPVHVENASTDVNGDYWMSTEYDGTNNYWVTVLFLEQSYTGTAESGTSNTLTDDIAQFTTDEFNDGTYLINLTGGTGSGQSRIILSNTADTVTVEYDWSVTPDATTEYEIGRIFSTSSNYHTSKQ